MAEDKKKLQNRSREPTDPPTIGTQFEMVNLWNERYIAWNGQLFDSDIVRACIRPKVKAAGKFVAKHIRDDPEKGLQLWPKVAIRELLRCPNPFMTAQMFQEKMTTQLCLNNNAFALIIRNPETGTPIQLYPIPAISVEAIFDENQRMYLKFLYRNGKSGCFPYDDILHLRQDWYDNEVFGSPIAPALASLMECVGTIDQGIVKAVQNSGAIRWLLKYATPMRPEDLKSNVKQFVDNYMSLSSEVLGAAGVDGKADAIQIKPTDFVPGALIGDKIRERVYALFNTNAHIVQSDYTEDQWNAYYESEIEPLAIQFGSVLDQKIFSRKELAFGNQIVYESSNLAFASMRTKLDLVQLVDRGELSPNEHRRILNLPPIPGGDIYIRRLDTAPVEGGDGNAD